MRAAEDAGVLEAREHSADSADHVVPMVHRPQSKRIERYRAEESFQGDVFVPIEQRSRRTEMDLLVK